MITLPGSILSLEFFSRIVISVTMLLYLAMALIPFLPESETKPRNAEYREESIKQGGKK